MDTKNTVSFFSPLYTSAESNIMGHQQQPDPTELSRLKSGYRDLQKQLSTLEHQLLVKSQAVSQTGRTSTPKRRLKSSLRRSSESCDQTSLTASDVDLSTTTNTTVPFNSYSPPGHHRTATQSFDDFMQSTDAPSDMSSDGGDNNSLSLDNL
jgi:hypothetical protein